jgi:hypothetical protein
MTALLIEVEVLVLASSMITMSYNQAPRSGMCTPHGDKEEQDGDKDH